MNLQPMRAKRVKMNIYVGNLPYSASEDELRSAFGAHGEVTSVNIISDKYSGQSKGFGFVEMSDDSAGNKAIEALNGTDMGGRSLKVNQARPREERPRNDRSRDRY